MYDADDEYTNFCVVPDEATATSDWVLKEENLSALLSYIKDFSHKWSSIGIGLGFTPPELEEIKAMPSLFNTAPKSYLTELLNQWVQWPTTKHPTKPTLRAFCSALRNFVDLGSLADKVETGMNQAGNNSVFSTASHQTAMLMTFYQLCSN